MSLVGLLLHLAHCASRWLIDFCCHHLSALTELVPEHQTTRAGLDALSRLYAKQAIVTEPIEDVTGNRQPVCFHSAGGGTQTTHQTSHGQLMDLITAPIGTVRRSPPSSLLRIFWYGVCMTYPLSFGERSLFCASLALFVRAPIPE